MNGVSMKLSEILTAVIAVYGALLSSTTLYLLMKAKRWRLLVRYRLGTNFEERKRFVTFRALNLGERSITLKQFEVLCEPKESLFRKIVDRHNPFGKFYGIGNSSRVFSKQSDFINNLAFPIKLEPGESCEAILDTDKIIESIRSMSFGKLVGQDELRIRGGFVDQLERKYRSDQLEVNLKTKEINFLGIRLERPNNGMQRTRKSARPSSSKARARR
jgi:hypothetical protein